LSWAFRRRTKVSAWGAVRLAMGNSARIVVVEDEAIIATDLEQSLRRLGHAPVGIAASGPQALRLVDTELPDLVLMDIRLKGQMDGVEAARLIREAHAIPVVYLTSHSDAATLARALEAGPAGFVCKPFDEAALRAALQIALRQTKVERELREKHSQAEAEVDALKETQFALEQRAITDELTGLYNRRGFMLEGERQISIARRGGRCVSIAFADLDGMKGVNDELGHAVGDQLLLDAARVLKSSFRDGDLIARLGGDEFVAMLVDTDPSFTKHIAPRVERMVAAFNGASVRPYQLSISLGVATLVPEAGAVSLDQLMERADAAMYDIKSARATRSGLTRAGG